MDRIGIRSRSQLPKERIRKGRLLIATLVGMVMSALVPCAYADLYVIDQDSNSVLRYNEVNGTFLDTFVSSGSGGLNDPKGMLFGRDGNLYVTSINTQSVMRYDGNTGAPLPAAGETGATFVLSGSGGLQDPAQFILGRDGNLYVGSQGNNSVLRYDGTTGDFIDEFIPAGSGGLNTPRGLVFGPDGNLYVNSQDTVLRFDGTTGAPLPAAGQMGAVFASRDVPSSIGFTGLIFGPDGNLYIGDYDDSSVLRFNGATGEFMDTFVSPGSGGLDGPSILLLFGPDNNLYICSREGNQSVLRFDGTTGAFVDVFIASGAGGLLLPNGLCFTNTDPTTHSYGRGPANHILITASRIASAGTPFDVTLTALDVYGNVDTTYQGTVTFSSSDAYPGVLPADYTFTSGDQGMHTFSGGAMLFTAGAQTLTVQDTATSSIMGSATVGVVAAPASQFLIIAPATAVSSTPFDVTLAALDPYANVDMNYGGTVTWTSSDTDPGVLLPADYTFQLTDNGMVTFSGGVTLITLGNQSLTATDTVSGITGSATVTVGP